MSSFFSKPKIPAPVITAPVVDTAAQEAARLEAERLRKKRRGVRSTILTGPKGITEAAPILKTMLGG